MNGKGKTERVASEEKEKAAKNRYFIHIICFVHNFKGKIGAKCGCVAGKVRKNGKKKSFATVDSPLNNH